MISKKWNFMFMLITIFALVGCASNGTKGGAASAPAVLLQQAALQALRSRQVERPFWMRSKAEAKSSLV